MRYQTAPRPVREPGLFRGRGRRGRAGKRVTGVEPALGAWKAPVQPIHLTRVGNTATDYRGRFPVLIQHKPVREAGRPGLEPGTFGFGGRCSPS